MDTIPIELLDYILSFTYNIDNNATEYINGLLVCSDWYKILNTNLVQDLRAYMLLQQRLQYRSFKTNIKRLQRSLVATKSIIETFINICSINIYTNFDDGQQCIDVDYCLIRENYSRTNYRYYITIDVIHNHGIFSASLSSLYDKLYDINISITNKLITFDPIDNEDILVRNVAKQIIHVIMDNIIGRI